MRRGFKKKTMILLTGRLNRVAQHLKLKKALCTIGEIEHKHNDMALTDLLFGYYVFIHCCFIPNR